ncbi:MAG: M20/M25/M40 family metallo-hydrolase, partial [Pseudomonadota bacterium]|nr:M20/M25/M40 family metallo-hydrolase [Pseudomonadota bacterium]
MDSETFKADRRTVLQGASIGAALLSPGLAMAAPQRDRDAILASVESGYSQSVARIQDWIRSPSIAAEKHRMEEGAAYMMKLAGDAGFQQARVVRTDGAPAIFATLDAGAKHTLGLYFMYDVKQYDPAEWSSPPIEARIVDRPGEGKAIMGRGAVNQKGPQAAFLAALHAFKASGRKLPVNLVLVAEGEEEMASPHFSQVVADPEVAAALRKTVGVFMPAAGQGQSGHSAITLGAKGAVEFELVSDSASWGRGPAKDIHSSQFARVDSPAWRLVQALGTLMAPDGHTPAVEG